MLLKDAHIRLKDLLSADSSQLASFKDSKEINLTLRRHLCDFIQKQSAAVCLFEASGLLPHCAAEGSFFVPKQFALQKSLRHGTQVDGKERSCAAIAEIMQSSCDESLPVPLSP